jgi:RimJ/RimL family protein N-acetyltransferase
MMIRGELVYLTPLDPANAEQARVWINDPEVHQWLKSGHILLSKAAERAFYEESEQASRAGTAYRFEIRALAGNRLLGHCGLEDVDQLDRHAEVGLVIGETVEWGKGYGGDAIRALLGFGFQTLGLHRIWISSFPKNERALALYRRLGFAECGRDRETHFLHGEFHDLVRLDLLDREWRAAPA